MDDIIKYDVRTYVEELIKEEFSSKNNEDKTLSDKREINTAIILMCGSPPLQSSAMEEQFQN
jgi:hypothetical protein